jgi:amidophosphoribosyltransferase
MRDPSGIRPAFYFADEDIIAVASEMPLIQTVFNVGEKDVKPIPPGHAMCVKRSGTWTMEKILEPLAFKQCSFERIYFSRGNDAGVYREREQLGRLLLSPLLTMLEGGGDSLSNAVLSFIPNTSELAYYGLVKEAQDHLDRKRQATLHELLRAGTSPSDVDSKLEALFSEKARIEKVIHKDAKIRTFIQEDSSREHLTMHAYDLHYGTIRCGQDVVVALDDSIVRGNTLKNAILRTLDRPGPTRIIVLSTCPQIRYPDVYGIDMAKLGDLAAFKAAIGLLRDRNMHHIIDDVYHQCKAELAMPLKGRQIVNHMKRIYEAFTAEEISERIAKDVKPHDLQATVQVLFQTVDDLHKALPEHCGDWYFTGDYPTQGGARVCCRAFVLWMEGSSQRCYGVDSALSRRGNNVLVLGCGGCEHAIAWKMSRSADVTCVFVAPGNGGMGEPDTSADSFSTAPMVAVDLKVDEAHIDDIISFCKRKSVGLVVVGSEQYLTSGIADALKKKDIQVFGPTQEAAEIHSSMMFAKAFMERHGVPSATEQQRHRVFCACSIGWVKHCRVTCGAS